ncbi:MAG: ornithine cyclodeaminase [Candidatus Rokubacteria bacterium]|nr:ornithine cyclodeaminase [Candidatus Rokubacteria bacterium]
MLVLGRPDLEKLLAPRDVIDALAAAFRRHAAGLTHVPPRGVMPVTDDGVLLLMPAVARADRAGGAPAAGAKLVTYYANNRARGAPTIHATYVLLDAPTGRPLALLEGTYLTGLRTGATSALAARYLARPDARRLVCFGAGVQAVFQLRCLAAVRPVERVDVIGRDPARARAFADAMRAELGIPVEIVADARAAVRGADLVTCATTSTSPVVSGADLRPGVHVDAVGAFRPDAREVDTETVRRARVVVDTYAGALEEAGDVLIPMKEGALSRDGLTAELAELVTGARPGRESADQITFFKSVGSALEDLATAELAYRLARARGAGTEITL